MFRLAQFNDMHIIYIYKTATPSGYFPKPNFNVLYLFYGLIHLKTDEPVFVYH